MIDTRYGDGNVSTSITGLGIPGAGGSDLSSLFRRLVEARLGPKPGAAPLRVARPSAPVMHTGGDNSGGSRYAEDPLRAMKLADQYDLTRRSAAMRPTGLGPGMIPGMAVDPRLVSSRMLPGGSSLYDPIAEGRARAEADREGVQARTEAEEQLQPQSSNSGFDYMSPVEKARWAAAAARSAPPPRR